MKISSDDRHRLRGIWFETETLVTSDCPPEKISEVLSVFSSDDLHELAHGQSMEDGTIASEIVRHPLCDWGSAFEILHSYSAAAYQSYWREGKSESDFDQLEQSLFNAFATISERAVGKGFRTRKFAHNMERSTRIDSFGNPDPYYPSNWIKWSLPEQVLRPTDSCKHKPTVEFDCGRILPNFESWLVRQGPLH